MCTEERIRQTPPGQADETLSVPKIVIHTDVFLEHLSGDRHPSVLRVAMQKFFCYATVFQAIELFSLARSQDEYSAVEDAMSAMKILGLNPKNARRYGDLLAFAKGTDPWNVLIAGLCVESRLPLLTDRKKEFRHMKGLVVIPTRRVGEHGAAGEALHPAP